MENLRKDLKEIRNKIQSEMLHGTDSSVLQNIGKIDDGIEDSKIRETLILIYSNYRAEIDLIKKHNINVISELIHVNIGLIDKLAKDIGNKIGEKIGMLELLMRIPGIVKFILAFGLVLVIAIIGYVIIPEKMDTMFDVIKTVFDNRAVINIKQ